MKIKLLLVLGLGVVLCAGCETYFGLPGAGTSQELSAVEEIDRAIARSRDPVRMKKLILVATRPGLDPVVQVYLVNRAYGGLSLPESKKQLFILLSQNPAFTSSTRQQILQRIDELGSENAKAEVLQALNLNQSKVW